MADPIEIPLIDVNAPELPTPQPRPEPQSKPQGQGNPENIGTSAPYARRRITLTFQLGASNFQGTGANKLTLEGLRVHFQSSQALTPSPSQAVIRVFGLTPDQINTLTKAGTLFTTPGNQSNYVLVQAGDYGGKLTTVYKGVIYEAYPDFAGMPDTAFTILANPSFGTQLTPVSPVTFPGSVATGTALQQIARQAGITVENNGVNASLQSPYFPGTVWQQLLRVIQAANCFAFLDSANNKLAVWPKNAARQGPLQTVSPKTGMIGYPEFMHARLRIRMTFDPSLQGLDPGHVVNVQSQLKAANARCTVDQVDYDLESEQPGGPWEMTLLATPQAAVR